MNIDNVEMIIGCMLPYTSGFAIFIMLSNFSGL